jgi:hypothetical protein
MEERIKPLEIKVIEIIQSFNKDCPMEQFPQNLIFILSESQEDMENSMIQKILVKNKRLETLQICQEAQTYRFEKFSKQQVRQTQRNPYLDPRHILIKLPKTKKIKNHESNQRKNNTPFIGKSN